VEDHDQQVVVSYNFTRSRMLVEPLMLIASFFVFFIVCSAIARLETPGKKTA
jgi:Ribophorin I